MIIVIEIPTNTIMSIIILHNIKKARVKISVLTFPLHSTPTFTS